MSTPKRSVKQCAQRVETSLDTMATSTGTLQARLADAMVSGIGVLLPSDFPVDLRPEFSAMYAAMTSSGSFAQTAAVMTDEEASAVATRLWHLGRTVIRRDALEDHEGVE